VASGKLLRISATSPVGECAIVMKEGCAETPLAGFRAFSRKPAAPSAGRPGGAPWPRETGDHGRGRSFRFSTADAAKFLRQKSDGGTAECWRDDFHLCGIAVRISARRSGFCFRRCLTKNLFTPPLGHDPGIEHRIRPVAENIIEWNELESSGRPMPSAGGGRRPSSLWNKPLALLDALPACDSGMRGESRCADLVATVFPVRRS